MDLVPFGVKTVLGEASSAAIVDALAFQTQEIVGRGFERWFVAPLCAAMLQEITMGVHGTWSGGCMANPLSVVRIFQAFNALVK